MPTPLSLNGLHENEAAYRLESGDTVVLTTTRFTKPEEPAWLFLRIDADLIDPATMATRAPHIVSTQRSIQLEQLETGRGLATHVEQAHAEACTRVANYLAAEKLLATIPLAPPPTSPVTRDRSAAPAKKKGGRA